MAGRILIGIAIIGLSITTANAGEKKKDAKKDGEFPTVLSKLAKAKSIQLLSLDPSVEKEKDDAKSFHGWKVLGATTVIDMKKIKTKTQVLNAIFKGVKDSNGEIAKCFIPRHGIAAVVDKESIELVVCFQCLRIEAYVDGKPATKTIATTANAGPVLNRILLEAKVTLPKQAK